MSPGAVAVLLLQDSQPQPDVSAGEEADPAARTRKKRLTKSAAGAACGAASGVRPSARLVADASINILEAAVLGLPRATPRLPNDV